MVWIVAVLLCLALGAAGWIMAVGRALTRLHSDAEQALRQLLRYQAQESLCACAPNAGRTREQVELSQAIYQGVAAAYNRCLKKPVSRIPARLLGYHPMEEEGGV